MRYKHNISVFLTLFVEMTSEQMLV